jgi:hypothetical protein
MKHKKMKNLRLNFLEKKLTKMRINSTNLMN